MLFHITATHTPEDCPLYNEDARAAAGGALGDVDALAQEAGVTLHFMVSPAPEHALFVLLEADTYQAVGAFLKSAFPFPSDFSVSPVISHKDVVALVNK